MNWGDAGTFMYGAAAMLALLVPAVLAVWRRLGHINHAVNNKKPEEPTLREVAVGTSDLVVTLAERLGELKATVEKHSVALTEHTAQDATNFGELRVGQQAIADRMESIADAREASAQSINEENRS